MSGESSLPSADGPAPPAMADPQAREQQHQSPLPQIEAARTLNALGAELLAQGDLRGSCEAYSQLTQLLPQLPEAHHNLGVVLRQLGDLPGACACCFRAVELAPDDPEAHYNLGLVQAELGEAQAAAASYRRALALRPDDPGALNNLGGVLWQLDELEEASDCCLQLLRRNPMDAQAHLHLGLLHWENGELQAALECFDQALAMDPHHAEAERNRGMVLLCLDNAAEGWPAYEARLLCADLAKLLSAWPPLPLWQGPGSEAPGPENRLLLVAEQGLGDSLQFMRYLPGLRQRGWEVQLCAPQKLHGLIRSSGIDPAPLLPEQAQLLSSGSWLPLLSLPLHLGVSRAQPLHQEPYLRTRSELIARWHQRLATAPRPLIGLNWQGNPRKETGNFRGRSLPLEAFAPLASSWGGSLVALQQGPGSEQLASCSFRDRFVACQEQVSASPDFLETAAVIANCDLVISSDTAVAHLAGGMGHPTWLLLKKVPDWRWGLEGEHSPWYPTLRLFRQRERGNWPEVMERLAAALATEGKLERL